MPFSVLFHQTATCVNQSFSCFRAVDWYGGIDWVNDVDWFGEFGLVATSVLMASIITPVIILISKKYPNFPIWDRLFNWIRLPDWIQQANMPAVPPQSTVGTITQGRSPTCQPQMSRYDSTRRTAMTNVDVCIYAWPSKGGVIIHDHAEAVDLEFLGLDPLDPPTERLPDQNDEDAFCQRLLLLGAKWWDSEARFCLLKSADEMDDRAIQALEYGTAPIPTMRERRWVSVAWPTTGGLWVAEFDTTLWGIIEDDNLLPCKSARLKLARTMDERSQVLRDHFRPKFYDDVREYKGYAFLNSWEEKETGEVGPLMPLRQMV